MTGITDDMIAKAARSLGNLLKNRDSGLLDGWDVEGSQSQQQIAKLVLEAALAGRVVVDLDPSRKWIEFCRACRDERDEIVPADFILWGKLLPAEQLGPRCYDHTTVYIGALSMARIDQWAVFDLRPFNRALNAVSGGVGGDTR